MIRSICRSMIFATPTLYAHAAWAGDETADAADTFATIYVLAGGLVIAGIGALITWGIGKLRGTTTKEMIGRFLGVFSTGLQGAHARFKQRLEEAREPSSPGGVVITDAEWAAIRDDMWQYLLATYGSWEQIAEIVAVIIGSGDEKAVKAFVDSKIDAGIAELERLDRAAASGNPQ